jgi:hypothetical protein
MQSLDRRKALQQTMARRPARTDWPACLYTSLSNSFKDLGRRALAKEKDDPPNLRISSLHSCIKCIISRALQLQLARMSARSREVKIRVNNSSEALQPTTYSSGCPKAEGRTSKGLLHLLCLNSRTMLVFNLFHLKLSTRWLKPCPLLLLKPTRMVSLCL